MIAGPVKPIVLAILPLVFIFGSFRLASYSTQPGETGAVMREIDNVECALPLFCDLPDEQFKIFVAYHPHCPCTLSTVRCLQRLQVRLSQPHTIVALAYTPANRTTAWLDTQITAEFNNLANIQLIKDVDGVATKELGIKTSGHILAYRPCGTLVFSGGITPGRGHEGDCPASNALIKLINDDSDEQINWPVFGCSFE